MGILKNVTIYRDGALTKGDVSLAGGVPSGDDIAVFPGFADVHVHLREPGFSYKETVLSGTRAAARGGYTCLCAMPNLDPAPDGEAGLSAQLSLINAGAVIRVYPLGCLTKGRAGKRLADMADMAPYVRAFSDDGCGVMDAGLMREAMEEAKRLGRIVAAHCEDAAFPPGESEWRQLERDLELAAATGCAYHACHISKKESVALMRNAKASGLDVSCESAPHYLLLDESAVRDEGRFKMNPPIGTAEDREALAEALCDGTVDMIATDHAPHSAEEKSRGFKNSLSGVVGLECAFPALYTGLVLRGLLPLSRLVELMSAAPSARFGLARDEGDLCVWDLGREYTIDSGEFLSMGKSTPFEGMRVRGRCLRTLADGETVWEENKNAKEN